MAKQNGGGKGAKGSSESPQASVLPAPVALTDEQAWRAVAAQLDAEALSQNELGDKQGFASFELDFENALARQLWPAFAVLPSVELNAQNIALVPPKARGAYMLELNGTVIYIGKSDAKAGLRLRLDRHFHTLKCRTGIDFTQMKFKAVKVASLAALDTESLLLDVYARVAEVKGVERRRPLWNFSGFGSNDTGRERDTQRVSVFDQHHPLDLTAVIDLGLPGASPRESVWNTITDEISLYDYVVWLASRVPFIFRKPGAPRKELRAVRVRFADMIASTVLRALLAQVHTRLPSRWVLTVLRGKVVLYKDDQAAYKSPVLRLESGVAAAEPDYVLRDVGNDADDADD